MLIYLSSLCFYFAPFLTSSDRDLIILLFPFLLKAFLLENAKNIECIQLT